MNEYNNRNYRVDPNRGIVAKIPFSTEFPQITVEIKSGKTTYRFTGRYDGSRSLSAKLLDHMARDNLEKE